MPTSSVLSWPILLIPMPADPEPLQPYRAVQASADAQLRRVLEKAAKDIQQRILRLPRGVGGEVRAAQLRVTLAAIKKVQRQLWRVSVLRSVSSGIDGAEKAAESAIEMMTRVAYASLSDAVADALVDGLRLAAESGLKSDAVRRNRELSTRVYRQEAFHEGRLEQLIRSGLVSNLTAKELATGAYEYVSPTTPGGASYAAMRLARTEINNAFHERQVEGAKRPGVKASRWNLSGSHKVPDECNVFAVQNLHGDGPGLYPAGKIPDKPHPQCFPAGSFVIARNVRAVTKRWYEGDLIHIGTSKGGPDLTGTPNHPALTTRGWIALGELRQGDYVLGSVPSERVITSGPHHENVPTRIEDVFETFSRSGSGASRTMPVSPKDFHGDGIAESQVHIVGTDGVLQPSLSANQIMQVSVERGDVQLPFIPSKGSGNLGFDRLGNPSTGGVGSIGHGESFIEGFSTHGFPPGSHGNSGTSQSAPDLSRVDAEGGRSFAEGLAGQVELYRVVSVRTDPGWSGHVYNLETDRGYYTTNGITVHNCFCFLTYVSMAPKEFSAALASGDFDDELDRRTKANLARLRK